MTYPENNPPASVAEYMHQCDIDKVYSSQNLLHLSQPFWRPKLDQQPLHTQLNWNGSSLPQISGVKVLKGMKEFLIKTSRYQGININTNEYNSVLPLPFP
jgi:hypothetical protein